MDDHDCQDLPDAPQPKGTPKALADYLAIEHVMLDVVRMSDGRWLLSYSQFGKAEDGQMVEMTPAALFITNPPSYVRPDCDADVSLLADLTANVLMHQAREHYAETQGGRHPSTVRTHS